METGDAPGDKAIREATVCRGYTTETAVMWWWIFTPTEVQATGMAPYPRKAVQGDIGGKWLRALQNNRAEL